MARALSQPFEAILDACVAGQYPDGAELSQQKWKKSELPSADTYRKDMVFTHHQPE